MDKEAVSQLLSAHYVPYRPEFHRLPDKDGKPIGENAALFLSDIFYWTGKGADPEGWIYKSQQDMEAEIGLTRSKQDAARKKLKDIDVLQEDRRGERGVMHYRIDMDILANLLNGYTHQIAENPQTELQENDIVENPQCENPANQIAENPQTELQKTGNLLIHKDKQNEQQKGGTHPAVRVYKDVTGHYVGKVRESIVIERLGDNPEKQALEQAYRFWLGKGYNSTHLDGILDYYDNIKASPGWTPNGRSFSGPSENDIWRVVLDHARRGDAGFENPAVKAAVKAAGWPELQTMKPGSYQESQLKTKFLEAYHAKVSQRT